VGRVRGFEEVVGLPGETTEESGGALASSKDRHKAKYEGVEAEGAVSFQLHFFPFRF
jgi:hypothetical protein